MTPTITIVYSDDWEGLYRDGTLITQGHSISVNDVLSALGVKYTRQECNQWWIEQRGILPESLDEVL